MSVSKLNEAPASMPRPSLKFARNVAAPTDVFVGRATEIASIVRRLEASELIWVAGPPGVGKTRLAQESVNRLAGVDVWFVDAHQIADEAALLAAISGVIGAREAETALDLGWALARRGPTVVVLDNVDDVNDVALQVGEALQSVGVGVLATSRVLAPDAVVLAGLPAAQGRQLFIGRTDEPLDLDDIDTLIAKLGGLPLAIEIAASQMDVMTPGALIQRLSRGVDGPGGSLDLAIQESWNRLETTQQRALVAASICGATSFDLDALEAVIGGPAQGSIRALMSQSLVSRVVASGYVRFRVYDAVRDFVVRQGHTAGPEFESRHTQYFADRAFQCWGQEHTRDIREAIDWLGREQAAILLALSRAQAAASANQACRLALGLTLYHRFIDILGPLLPVAETTLALGPSHELEFALRYDYANVLMDENLPSEAKKHVDWLAETAQGSCEEAAALRSEARLLHHRGEGEMAAQVGARAIQVAQDADDPFQIAVSQRFWGGVAFSTAEHQAATVQVLTESADRFRRIDAPHDEAMSHYMLSYALDERSNPTRQRDAIERAHALFAATGDYGLALESKRLLGNLEGALGRHEEAAELLNQVYHEALGAGMISVARPAAETLLSVCIDAGDLIGAAKQLERQQELLERQYDAFGLHWLRVQRGRILAHSGDFAGAVELLEAAVTADAIHWNPAFRIWPRGVLIVAYLKHGQVGPATSLHAETQGMVQAFGSPEWNVFADVAAAALAFAKTSDDLQLINDLSRIQADPQYASSAEVRSLVRLLSSGLSLDLAITGEDALLVSEDGTRFRAPGATEWTDIRRRKRLVSVFNILVQAKIQGELVGVEDLIAQVWPDETLTSESALNRIRATISMLRKAGLGDCIAFEDGGYCIRGDVATRRITG